MSVSLGLTFAGAALARTTTTVDVRNFEVISVDGNKLVVHDQKGTQKYTVSGAEAAQPATSAAAPQPRAAEPASRPTKPSILEVTWYVVIALLIALVLFGLVRKRKAS